MFSTRLRQLGYPIVANHVRFLPSLLFEGVFSEKVNELAGAPNGIVFMFCDGARKITKRASHSACFNQTWAQLNRIFSVCFLSQPLYEFEGCSRLLSYSNEKGFAGGDLVIHLEVEAVHFSMDDPKIS